MGPRRLLPTPPSRPLPMPRRVSPRVRPALRVSPRAPCRARLRRCRARPPLSSSSLTGNASAARSPLPDAVTPAPSTRALRRMWGPRFSPARSSAASLRPLPPRSRALGATKAGRPSRLHGWPPRTGSTRSRTRARTRTNRWAEIYSWPEPAYVNVGTGSSCATATFASCPYPGIPKPTTLTLTAGTALILVADFTGGCDTMVDPGCAFTAETYNIRITHCTPACAGLVCGDDGCGGSCGTCPSPETCTAAGACECAPACDAVECGSDGCGGSCGACTSGSICTEGQCVCAPSCGTAVCGDDGCGGSCGPCALDTNLLGRNLRL